MKITFGLNLDGGNWPEFEHGFDALLGDVVLGPQGLIGLLETHLGLGEEQCAQAIRIRRYMGRLLVLNDDSSFYFQSLQADAWATARELLTWRDELIFYGWNPEQDDAPARLTDLAAIEVMDVKPLPSGFSDRFRMVLNTVKKRPSLPIASIHLIEPMQLLPTPWRELVSALGKCGVEVSGEDAPVSNKQSPELDLDAVVMLTAEHEGALARSVAAWLKGEDDKSSSVLLCQQDSGKLDEALRKQGLPQTGQGEESAQKGILQLLPLVLENLWKPVRIEHLVELLSAPLSPVPGFAANRLISVLARKPGLESAEWDHAIAEIADVKCKFLIKDGMKPDDAKQEADAFANDLNHWLKHDRLDINVDAPVAVIVRAIERLQQHLSRFQHLIPMAFVAMGHCRDLAMILADLGQINKSLLDRILDDVIGPGRSANSVREAAAWGVIDDAGQLCGDVDTLIWWGFNDHSAPASNIWTNEERGWLESSGVHLDAPSLGRARERYHWLGCLHRCKRLLLCRTTIADGTPTIVHPLWSELENKPCMQDRLVEIPAMALLQQKQPELLGRQLSLGPAGEVSIKDIDATKYFEPGAYDKPAKLSPTSLSSLFGCSFKWLLEQLDVSASDMMNIQNDSALIGTLAHQVLEDVFAQGSIPEPDDASAQAEISFDKRMPEMAAELLLPENSVERANIRARVMSAASDLACRFDAAGFTRLTCEEWIHTTLDGIKVNGRADVIAYAGNNEPHVIDFKYSYARNYYEGKIAKGRDIQLITYSRMIDNKPKPVAYYLIPLGRMITAFPAFRAETVEIGESLNEGWNRVRKTCSSELQQLRKGEALASGLVDEEEREAERGKHGLIHESPPCRFCDYASLCGLNALGGGE